MIAAALFTSERQDWNTPDVVLNQVLVSFGDDGLLLAFPPRKTGCVMVTLGSSCDSQIGGGVLKLPITTKHVASFGRKNGAGSALGLG